MSEETKAFRKVLEIYSETTEPVTQSFYQGLCEKSKEIIQQFESENNRECKWERNKEYDFKTECNHVFEDTYGATAEEYGFKFCPYCGRILKGGEL